MKKHFIITIDTEGDNLWDRSKPVTTNNSRFLIRFQQLCEKYSLKPSYLTNYEMVQCPVFIEFAKDALARNEAEIGMHLHAWDTPPLIPLTADDGNFHPYLIEYSDAVMREKIHVMTEVLEQVFQKKMTSHRAGRWSFDVRYAKMLIDEGYKVDCSVTPRMSWSNYSGAPSGSGGTDYTMFPSKHYWIDVNNISKSGTSSLLEVPLSVVSLRSEFISTFITHAKGMTANLINNSIDRIFNKIAPDIVQIRPTGNNITLMLKAIRKIENNDTIHAELMIHSSEFMPGGSPYFVNDYAVEKLYDDLECLFSSLSDNFIGSTLTEFHDVVKGMK
jgi:hypothetical protein